MCQPSTEIKSAYADIAAHTLKECGQGCLNFGHHRCCNNRYCKDNATIIKSEYGIDLPRTDHPEFPFMGIDGCTLKPWQRPKCSVHHCQISALGRHKSNVQWTDEYFELLDRINDLEMSVL